MPVCLNIGYERSWKKQDFSDPVLIMNFIDSKTGNILFKYAPKITDENIFADLWHELEALENFKKEQKKLCALKEKSEITK